MSKFRSNKTLIMKINTHKEEEKSYEITLSLVLFGLFLFCVFYIMAAPAAGEPWALLRCA